MTQEAQKPVDEYLKELWGPEIKPGREDSILRNDPRLAAEVDKRLRAEPSPDGVYAPKTFISPDSVVPVAYVLHNFCTRCTLCNTEHRWSEMYALNHLRATWGTFVRHMVPVQKLEWQVPLKVHNLSTKTVVGCWECSDAVAEILKTLPLPPVPQAVVKLDPPKTEKAPSGAARTDRGPKPTLDDFV